MFICVIKRKLGAESIFTLNLRAPLHQESVALNALAELLELSKEAKIERGLLHTPAEIAQQPATWGTTFSIFQKRRGKLADFLKEAGFDESFSPKPTVFLIGAGTSDYVGRSLELLFRRLWQCEVIAISSTSLLTHAEEWLL